MYATLTGYRVNWKAGPDDLLLVSVGIGSSDASVRRSQIAAAGAFQARLALMDDVATLQETTVQWMLHSATARKIDRELGTLDGDDRQD